MVFFLVEDVFYDLGTAVWKCSIPFLPTELSPHPPFFIDEMGGVGFDLAHQIWNSHVRLQADKDMTVIRHAVNGEHSVSPFLHDTSDVFVEFFFVWKAIIEASPVRDDLFVENPTPR